MKRSDRAIAMGNVTRGMSVASMVAAARNACVSSYTTAFGH